MKDGARINAGENIATKAFHCIAQRLVKKRDEIAVLATSYYSFEEWCNWEAYLACSQNRKWEVFAKPRYQVWGAERSTTSADLVIEEKLRSPVIVEVGLVHDDTLDKWDEKLNRDREKLRSIKRIKATRLQIIVAVASKKSNSKWNQGFLARNECWIIKTKLEKARPLCGGGQMVIRGWIV